MAETALDAAIAYFDSMEVEKISQHDVPKNARCFSFALDAKDEFKKDKIPRCYTENTSKEELVLEHVLEYNR